MQTLGYIMTGFIMVKLKPSLQTIQLTLLEYCYTYDHCKVSILAIITTTGVANLPFRIIGNYTCVLVGVKHESRVKSRSKFAM